MSIWHNKQLSLASFDGLGKQTMGEYIGIRFSEVGDNYLKATMPVDHRTIQPYGLLHGGASVTLAETLGSVGAAMVIDPEQYICVGQEINANHIRGVKSGGMVTGIATPVHIGASSHVWEIKIYDEAEKLVCISRLTVAILKKR
ncbi:MAG: hotdog fold thioesterase [Bacteroidota bacterium]